jgi:hypothetical protein
MRITTLAFAAVTMIAASPAGAATQQFTNAVVMCRTEVQSINPTFNAYIASSSSDLVNAVGTMQQRYAFFSCLSSLGIPLSLGPVHY